MPSPETSRQLSTAQPRRPPGDHRGQYPEFEDDPDVVRTEDYDVSIQRVYFLDEVHRSYNPKAASSPT